VCVPKADLIIELLGCPSVMHLHNFAVLSRRSLIILVMELNLIALPGLFLEIYIRIKMSNKGYSYSSELPWLLCVLLA